MPNIRQLAITLVALAAYTILVAYIAVLVERHNRATAPTTVVATGYGAYTAPTPEEMAAKLPPKKEEQEPGLKMQSITTHTDPQDGELWLGLNLNQNQLSANDLQQTRALMKKLLGRLKAEGYGEGRPDRDGRLVIERLKRKSVDAKPVAFPFRTIERSDARYKVTLENPNSDRTLLGELLTDIEQHFSPDANPGSDNKKTPTISRDEVDPLVLWVEFARS